MANSLSFLGRTLELNPPVLGNGGSTTRSLFNSFSWAALVVLARHGIHTHLSVDSNIIASVRNVPGGLVGRLMVGGLGACG